MTQQETDKQAEEIWTRSADRFGDSVLFFSDFVSDPSNTLADSSRLYRSLIRYATLGGVEEVSALAPLLSAMLTEETSKRKAIDAPFVVAWTSSLDK